MGNESRYQETLDKRAIAEGKLCDDDDNDEWLDECFCFGSGQQWSRWSVDMIMEMTIWLIEFVVLFAGSD